MERGKVGEVAPDFWLNTLADDSKLTNEPNNKRYLLKGHPMRHFKPRYKLLVITATVLFVWALTADIPFTFNAGNVIRCEQMNQNFAPLNNGKQELIQGTCAGGSRF